LGDIDNLSQLERRWDCPETAPGNNKIRLSYIAVVPEFECSILDPQITVETPLRVECEYWNYLDDACLNLSLHVNNLEGVCIFNSVSSPVNLRSGLVKGICFIPGNFFNDESYQVTMMIVQDTSVPLYTFENIVSFTVNDVARKGNWYGKWVGVVRPKFDWKLIVAEEGDRVRA
jgi:lipopolysaccharide transport system ATP-binding protein